MTRAAWVLINGAPGTGKSTIATLLTARYPGALALDVDTIKHPLGDWPDDSQAAGLEARRLALTTAGEHLRAGHDVFLGQYLARTDFIEQLDALAGECEAVFVEILLTLDEDALAERLSPRHTHPSRPERAVNNALVHPDDAPALVASLAAIPTLRPATAVVDASGSPTAVADAVEQIVARLR